MEASLVEVKKVQSPGDSQRVITIDSSKGNRAHKVVLHKFTEEITLHIRPLYVRAHFNGRTVSKVLVDNGSALNVISLKMLRALGWNIDDLIET